MKISKRQLQQIIREEKHRILNEGADDEDVERFEEIMEEMKELNHEALEIARTGDAMTGERAYRYWYAHIDGAISQEGEFMGGSMTPMSETLEDLRGGDEDEMMEQGYSDGADGKEPEYPDNEAYMTNFMDGAKDR